MIQRFAWLTIGAVAVVLIALGIFWKLVVPPEVYWSAEDAREYESAFLAAHAAQRYVEGQDPTETEKKFEAAHQEYDRMRSELKSAQTARSRMGKYVTVAGLLLLLTSVLLRQFGPRTAE
jgi:hypothetical protein